MLKQSLLAARYVVKRNRLVKNAEITSFAQVAAYSEYEPHRIVVESAADTVISALGKRLVLMVASAIGKLGRCDIYYALAGTLRNLMHESNQVLVGVTESHASANAALKERCATREAEGNHALVLVPDIDRTVHSVISALDIEDAEQIIPVFIKLAELGINLGYGI